MARRYWRRKRDPVVIHPPFLLPFRFCGPEYRAAEDEGRIDP